MVNIVFYFLFFALFSLSTTVFAQLKILPLGDSITIGEVGSAGYTSPRGGYRWRLEDRLQAAGYNFDFIGSQWDAGWAQDGHHEGYSNLTIEQLHSLVNTNDYITQADIVLLMIGTANLNQPGFADMDDLRAKLYELLTAIIDKNKKAKIIISTVPNSVGAGNILAGEVAEYNNKVRIAMNQASFRGDVTRINGVAVVGTNLDDGLHPNELGEERLGDAFFAGIEKAHWDLYYRASLNGNSNGNDWYYSSYFGYFSELSPGKVAGWKYLPKLGLVWANKGIKGQIWFWHPGLNNWLLTDRTLYPWFLESGTSHWLYLNPNSTPNNRWMWNQTTQKWVSLP